MRTKVLKAGFLLIALLVTLVVLGGCGAKTSGQDKAAPQKAVVTDLAGRQVEVPVPANKVVAIGPGALRLVCYVNGADKVVGVEDVEKQKPRGKPYMLAHTELKDLPSIGQGGPDIAPDAEKLVSVKPEVIFVASLLDKSQADELQAKTNIPVVVLNYGTEVPFGENVYNSLLLIGKIIGNEKRAQEVVAYLKNCHQDLQERTKNIPADKKPAVYVGALGAKGAHGIESTAPKYGPFVAIGARNVVEEVQGRGSAVIENKKLSQMGRALGRNVMIEKEKLLEWDPDIIFIDESGLELVQNDYKKNPQFYQSLKAVKTGQVYGQIPFNFYNTNIDTAIADAYYAGKVIFPEQFKDIDPAKKADEIYHFLLGKPLYEQMAKNCGGFKKLDLAGP
ncbi:MAG: iron ABC transporter substrate-binding protein [Desulfotomaculales bacterium]